MKFLGNCVLDLEFLVRTLNHCWKIRRSFDIILNEFKMFKFNFEEGKFMVKMEGMGQQLVRFLL